MSDGMLSLSWNNHKATFCHILSTLREKEKYTDVTVACEGRFYPVHKLVLSTCSEYFEKIFDNTPCKHPVIVLKDIAWDELEALLSYMYDGVVSVAQNDLARLIKAAEVLRIKGLAVPDEPPPSRNDVSGRKSTQRNSDDRSSPHPKRRRREEIVPLSQSGARSSPPSSPARASPGLSESEPIRTHSDTRWLEHKDQNLDRPLDDRLHQSASATSSSPPQPPVEVMVDETLVKEEVEDSIDNRDDMLDSGMDYGSLGSDSRLDGSVGEDDGQMLPNKYEQKQTDGHSQPLPDAVVEALAGPSGMQGWLGGCEVPGNFSGMEGYGGDGSQDVHPPQQGPPGSGVQSGAHQMMDPCASDHLMMDFDENDPLKECGGPRVRLPTGADEIYSEELGEATPRFLAGDNPEKSPYQPRGRRSSNPGIEKPIQCSYCSYCTHRKDHLRTHMVTHTGEKPHQCPYCSYRAGLKTSLRNHIRRHTGEKPYPCPYCPYSAARKYTLDTHLLSTHARERNVNFTL